MQIYKFYILMRLVFCLAGTLFLLNDSVYAASNSKNPMDANTPSDSLYSQWNKEQRSKPYFAYDLVDFNDLNQRTYATAVVSNHGLGAVQISNGNQETVKSWISEINQMSKVRPLCVAKVQNFFELPFETTFDQPSRLEVECLRNDSLVFHLGVEHGNVLNEMGFDVIHFDKELINANDADWKKIDLYLAGLKKTGLFFSVRDDQKRLTEMIGWSQIIFLNQPSDAQGKELIKKRKQLRKDLEYEGLFFAKYDNNRGFDDKLNPLVEGAGMILLPENPQLVLGSTVELSKQSTVAIKKAVRHYFINWRKLKSRPKGAKPSLNLSKLNYLIHLESKVLLQDKKGLVPISDLGRKQIFTIFNSKDSNMEIKRLVDYYKEARHLSPSILDLPLNWILGIVPRDGLLMVDLNLVLENNRSESIIEKIEALQKERSVIGLVQGRINDLHLLKNIETLIWSPSESNSDFTDLVQRAFGAEKIEGKTPSYLAEPFGNSDWMVSEITRLKYANIREERLNYITLSKIDSIVDKSIKNREMPGCQIMMVHHGNVVYNRAFGHLSYDSLMPVEWDNLYDMASVTKTTVTVPAVMYAVEKNLIGIDQSLGSYIAELDSTNKSKILISKLLNHESGLKSYYPFWKKASYDSVENTFLYKQRKPRRRRSYNYFKVNWEDSVNAWVGRSDFNSLINTDSTFGYLYSDLGFMLLKQIVERKTKTSIDLLVDSLFFNPLGMGHTFFNPVGQVNPSKIAPTENDRYFRKRLLFGDVHDKNAALLGGVAGHAGLFSNANDMAKYMQMMMNFGNYGGQSFFDSTSVRIFTSKNDTTQRRALGWDKPSHSVENTSKYASEESFGHSGFSGTLVWADPKYDLIYIFLSNRIHPDPQNYKLIESNTRTKIHDIMYESILSKDNSQIHDM